MRNGRDPTDRLRYIIDRSFIVYLDEKIALYAADVKQKYGLHTVDAIIYATSKIKNLKLLTGDLHFKSLPDVELI